MADVAESVLGGSIGAGSAATGRGLKSGLYTATKAGATDTVTFDDFVTVRFVIAKNNATGAADPVTDITTNVVTLSVGTGLTDIIVWGDA